MLRNHTEPGRVPATSDSTSKRSLAMNNPLDLAALKAANRTRRLLFSNFSLTPEQAAITGQESCNAAEQLIAECERLGEFERLWNVFADAVIATEPHHGKPEPTTEALLDKVKEL